MPAVSNSYEPSLDDIMFVEFQISAVIIDMRMPLGWYPDDKDKIKTASVKALGDLKTIKRYLQQLSFTEDVMELKGMQLAKMDILIQMYDGIELKSTEDIKKAFVELDDFCSQRTEKVAKVFKKYEPPERMAKDFNTTQEEIKCIQNKQDRQVYLNAVELLKNRNFEQAYNDLSSLKGKYKDTVFESCLKLRMSDCILMIKPNSENISMDDEKGIALLSDILEDMEYSPVVYEAFYKWRTQTQFFWHGMSNMSEIPNWQYNLKRWQLIQAIRQYLKTNPDDDWAKAQAALLLLLPNIQRGGLYGNDNLEHFGKLYTDVYSDENKRDFFLPFYR